MNLPSREDFRLAAEGKTKRIMQSKYDPRFCVVVSSDRITAGDGKRSDVIPGKGALSNRVTCNVFRYLNSNWALPVAFREQNGPDSFVASFCEMIPLEVVCRFSVGDASSYRKRNPATPADVRFEKPILEFFVKTSGRKWMGRELPCDDPLLDFLHPQQGQKVPVYLPYEPLAHQKPLFLASGFNLGLEHLEMELIGSTAVDTAYALQYAWSSVGIDLHDFKMEFGRTMDGRLVIADVIDHDSWRISLKGRDLSKQLYRDRRPLDEVFAAFKLATELSERFPR
jgi:phosphoribosylaminoimidazole-succinocarboxamide synthase